MSALFSWPTVTVGMRLLPLVGWSAPAVCGAGLLDLRGATRLSVTHGRGRSRPWLPLAGAQLCGTGRAGSGVDRGAALGCRRQAVPPARLVYSIGPVRAHSGTRGP